MAKCRYCGKGAGIFSSKHRECEVLHRLGAQKYADALGKGITEHEGFEDLEQRLNAIAAQSFLKPYDIQNLVSQGFEFAVEKFLDDGLLSEDEESRVMEFKEHFGYSQEVLNRNGSYVKVGLAAVLRDIMEGSYEQHRIRVDGSLPFLFQKSEKIVWAFNDVPFYEQRTRTEYVGGSSGVSVRLAKGVYYRTSAFKGHKVQVQEMKAIGTGVLALTTKHIYYSCDSKTFKIPLNKIISLEPFEDGVSLQKDGVTAKPQVFTNLDGWFIYNAITNLRDI